MDATWKEALAGLVAFVGFSALMFLAFAFGGVWGWAFIAILGLMLLYVLADSEPWFTLRGPVVTRAADIALKLAAICVFITVIGVIFGPR